jgi:hypothetical protein
MSNSIWATLSAIDCNEHIEKKGQFSYLAWTWAWAMVKEHYPRAYYDLSDDIVYPDSTMEVRVRVGIPVSDESCALTHQMWLPVLDFKNKPIANPNAFDINTARMRCLVKCLAMFGLGHYIYAGESMPAPPAELVDKYEQMLGMVAKKQHWELRKFVDDNQPYMDNLFNMAPQGNKTKFKSDVREVYAQSNTDLKANLAALEELVGEGALSDEITEAWDEIVGIERDCTYKALNETLRKQLEEHIGELV